MGSSNGDSKVAIDVNLKQNLVDELIQKKRLSALELEKRENYTAIRFALADLYNNGFLYTQIHPTPDHELARTDKMLYRVYITTQKFWEYLERGEKIE